MAEEINQLLKIEIDQKAVNDAIAKAAAARAELDKLRKAQKELDVSTAEGAKAFTENSIAIKKNSEIVRTNEKIVVANEQAQEDSRGTIDRLRKSLVAVSAQWAKTTKIEGENSEQAQKLAKQKLDLTNKLKELEKATGDTRRNVGNYTDSIKEAISSSKNLFGAVVNVTVSIKNQIKEAGGFKAAFKDFVGSIKAATAASLKFLATPLGAVLGAIALAVAGVVGAFKTLRASLERTEKGQTAINRIMATFRGIANGLLKVLEPLAETLADGIAKGFDLVMDAVMAASGAIASALEWLGLDSWAEGLNKVNAQVSQMIEGSKELADAETELNKIRREQDKLQLESQKRAEELRQIRDNEELSIQKRIEANRELGNVLEEQQTRELELAQRALEIAELRAKVEGESTENLDAVAEAELKIAEIQERITSQRSEQLTNENALIKEAREARIAGIEEEEARLLERNQKQLDALEKQLAAESQIEQEYREKQQEIVGEAEIKLKEQYAQGLIDKQAYEEGLLEIERGTLAIRKLQAELAIEEANNDLELSEAERIRIITEAEKEILDVRAKSAEMQIKLNEASVKSTETTEAEKQKISVGSSNEILSNAKEVFGEESTAAKLAGVAQATISTYTAANKALASLPPPLNIAAAALITAKGLLNVGNIQSTSVPSFADGGFTGDGFGIPDSSGYKPAGVVHEGEYVVKKSIVDNPNFAPVLSYLESSRLKGYADGGMVGRSAGFEANQSSQLSLLNNSLNDLKNIQPIVKVSDIDRVSREVQTVRVSGALS